MDVFLLVYIFNAFVGRCWRLFMIKLWNHGLLDARTMNNCNITLERYQSQAPPNPNGSCPAKGQGD